MRLWKYILISGFLAICVVWTTIYVTRMVSNRPLEVGDTITGKLNYDLKRDGDTFFLTGYKERMRLNGIDAPEHNQNCVKGDKTVWGCGTASIRAMDDLIKQDRVSCKLVAKDLYPNRWDAVCSVRGIEINDWMVRQGWALAYVKYSKKYVAAETEAKQKFRGIWSDRGNLQAPWDFRREQKK